MGIQVLITGGGHYPYTPESKSYEGAENDNKKPWRPGLGLRHNRLVEHFYGRNFLGFLNLSQFILLGQNLKNSLINFGAPSKIIVGISEKRSCSSEG